MPESGRQIQLFASGQTNYHDSNSQCSQHTTVNNKTGQVQSHIDEFNPNDYFMNHVILDVIPDVIYDITGSVALWNACCSVTRIRGTGQR